MAQQKRGAAHVWFRFLAHQAGLRRLVRLATIRWQVQEDDQRQKDESGLDHYDGRGYPGWQHHATMNMALHWFPVLETLQSKETSGLILPKIRRMIPDLLAIWAGLYPICRRRINQKVEGGY
jgi:SRSO17 transposase